MHRARKALWVALIAASAGAGCGKPGGLTSSIISSITGNRQRVNTSGGQYKPSPELALARTRVRQAGLPLDPKELNQPLPPSDQNAAPLYKQLTRLLTAHPVVQEDAILNRVTGERMPDATQCEQIRRALKHRQDVVQLVHQAANRPQCVFNRDYSLGMDLTFPEYAKMREAVRILTAESTLLLHDGKPLEAIRNETLGFRIAQHSAQYPFIIAHLVEFALDSITMRWMMKCLYAAPDKPEVAQAIRVALATEYKPHPLSHAFKGELIIFTEGLERLRREGPDALKNEEDATGPKQKPAAKTTAWQRPADWDAQIDANETDYLQRMQKAIPAVDLPYVKSEPIFRALDREAEQYKNDPNHVYSVTMTSVYAQSTVKQAQVQARREVVRCAAAVLLWRRQHGVFPAKLEQAISPVPVDPFNNKPLGYRCGSSGDKGFVVYSVGDKQPFDGGTRSTKPKVYQTYFWYPMPAYYTQLSSLPPTAQESKH